MKQEIQAKVSTEKDVEYWKNVLYCLNVHLAKATLLDMHSKMLIHQLELLEKRKEELKPEIDKEVDDVKLPHNITNAEFGNADEELGLTNEIQLFTETATTQNNKYKNYNIYF